MRRGPLDAIASPQQRLSSRLHQTDQHSLARSVSLAAALQEASDPALVRSSPTSSSDDGKVSVARKIAEDLQSAEGISPRANKSSAAGGFGTPDKNSSAHSGIQTDSVVGDPSLGALSRRSNNQQSISSSPLPNVRPVAQYTPGTAAAMFEMDGPNSARREAASEMKRKAAAAFTMGVGYAMGLMYSEHLVNSDPQADDDDASSNSGSELVATRREAVFPGIDNISTIPLAADFVKYGAALNLASDDPENVPTSSDVKMDASPSGDHRSRAAGILKAIEEEASSSAPPDSIVKALSPNGHVAAHRKQSIDRVAQGERSSINKPPHALFGPADGIAREEGTTDVES
jgi:hypothetical protein